MRRLVVMLAIAAVALTVVERGVDHWQRTERQRASLVRPLRVVEADRVATIRVDDGEDTFTYRRQDDVWRYPAWHDAYADPARIAELLRALTAGSATQVDVDRACHAHYGLEAPRAVGITILDSSGAQLLSVQVGRGAPGEGAGEVYVRPTGADTVLHLHANPRHAIVRGDPAHPAPMLDPFVLPRALETGTTVEVAVRPTGLAPSYTLRRIEIETPAGEQRPAPGDGPTFVWLLVAAGADTLPSSARVHEYLGFVRRLRHATVHDPRRGIPSLSAIAAQSVRLIDETGAEVVLEVGGAPVDGMVHVFNRAAHLHVTITAAEAALLVPAAAAFRDTSATSPFRDRRP